MNKFPFPHIGLDNHFSLLTPLLHQFPDSYGEKQIRHSLNLNEEYVVALRTESYTEFSSKAQLLVSKLCSPNMGHRSVSILETLLEPGQDLVPTILELAMLPKTSKIKHLMTTYFDATAEASRVCHNILRSTYEMHSNYEFVKRALELAGGSSTEEYKSLISELVSFDRLHNPFPISEKGDIMHIGGHCSSILHRLKYQRKRVTRTIKLISCFKKAFCVCMTMVCSMFALVAVGVAVHCLPGLLLGPALFGFFPLGLKKLTDTKLFSSRYLRRLGEQLDVAARGAYTLARGFDTIGRLVARLHGEVEHDKEIVKFGLERKDEKYPMQQVMRELKKSDAVVRSQLEELEEHVWLCLVTINRARVMVINEMAASCPAS